MSTTFRNVGILLASTCGVLTAYAAFRPAFEEQQAERRGQDLVELKAAHGTAISDQMRQDFQEAGKELRDDKGFAWGIRQMFYGKNAYAAQNRGRGNGGVAASGQDSDVSQSKEMTTSDSKG